MDESLKVPLLRVTWLRQSSESFELPQLQLATDLMAVFQLACLD